MKSLRKRRILSILVLVILVSLVCLAVYLKNVADYKQAVQEISVGDMKISDIADGVYSGECNVNYIQAKVKVTIKKQRNSEY